MAEQDTQQQLRRLQKAREKAEELAQEKSRISGELGALNTQISDLETKCLSDFGCEIKELPNFIKQLKEESDVALCNAEIILGMREGTVKQAAPVVPDAITASKQVAFDNKEDDDAFI